MKIALIQYSPIWEAKEENIKKLNELITTSSIDADVLVFPEMTLTGFTMNSSKLAETIEGISFQYFSNFASKLNKDIFAGIIEEDGKSFYNSLVHFDNNGVIKNIYRKIHPFSLVNEQEHISAGENIVITDIGNVKIGLTICYDLRFPELYRLYAKEKVDVIINIANWPVPRIEHWKHLLKARAIENQCFIVGVNRVGIDAKSYKYNGCSSVFNPMGEEIVLLENDEKIIQTEIDISEVNKTRNKFGFLEDMKLI
ncbi:MAG: nitrilase-related carbon-nitrogen hydrolase [Melioribacteraceae bacterium]